MMQQQSILYIYIVISVCSILYSDAFISQPSLKSLRMRQHQDVSMAFDLGSIFGG